MIRKLRRKFLVIAMLSLLGTLAFLVAAIATGNAILSANRADRAIALLYENGGAFPLPDSAPNPALGFDFQVREETPFETRYFIARLSENQEVLSVDTEHIAALDRQTVIESLNAVLRSGVEKGYVDHYYRFGVFADEGGGSTVIVLDCFLQVQASLNMLRVTLLVSLAGALIVFVILLFSSRVAIRPFVENLERQRRFVTDASHELKTPITSISGYAEMMMTGLARSEALPLLAEKIYTEAQRLIALIDDIINLSRLDEGAVEAPAERVELLSAARRCAERLMDKAASCGVSVEVLGGEETVTGYAQLIDEMITNLCDNAIKYNRPGGHVRVTVGQAQGAPYICVEDDGIGIAAEHLDRVFERFYRVDKSRSKETGGTGLGLSIVKHAAAWHHATLKAESEPDKGTRISIIFDGKGGE